MSKSLNGIVYGELAVVCQFAEYVPALVLFDKAVNVQQCVNERTPCFLAIRRHDLDVWLASTEPMA